jgi:hypothetical protein
MHSNKDEVQMRQMCTSHDSCLLQECYLSNAKIIAELEKGKEAVVGVCGCIVSKCQELERDRKYTHRSFRASDIIYSPFLPAISIAWVRGCQCQIASALGAISAVMWHRLT